jgi:DNA-directed RNA polymerase subunit RPC12/RpoP
MNSCSRCGEEVNSRRAEWLTDQKLTVTCMSCGEKKRGRSSTLC